MAVALESELAALKSYVLGLNGPWIGPAQKEFEKIMGPGGPWESNTKALLAALHGIAVGLRNNMEGYTTGELNNVAYVAGTGETLPPANL
ncbi:WXG100 family type VII secretion target [Rhizomonospora bruguierae]|uniref:WXG100 family type VII secretion target n=1 Tax=Rhizomonospora bruguierae TaxID=1581705 RepID=UPI001BD1225C|nr:hypothetical protein [Micromonospora sp. NBRC 107566]